MTLVSASASVDFSVPVEGLELRGTAVGNGPAVLLLHAGGERRNVWKPVADRLSAGGFRAISVDLRGHGETAGADAIELAQHDDDVMALIRSFEGSVTLVGSSLGGFIALLMTTHADIAVRVEQIVLVDVVPDPSPVATREYLRSLEAAAAQAGQERAWEWRLIEDILSRASELRAIAAAANTPIALVRGSAGRVVASELERFSQLVPKARIRTVEGAGHLVAHDKPNELADVLLELLPSLAESATATCGGSSS